MVINALNTVLFSIINLTLFPAIDHSFNPIGTLVYFGCWIVVFTGAVFAIRSIRKFLTPDRAHSTE
ncbi:MAG TPA: hypothetical protein PKO25_01770 [Spirochaetota bacterium]|nr:hypothetical protein [Spirochaetota bacterium]HNU90583.1 hypothetical protein [Spirochaetota bacterium]HPV96909.1 hypothetical protein [Spirochaetota bacterium]